MSYKINQKKIAQNTISLYIRMGFTMLVSFFTTRIVLQVLGVEDYGLNNLVGSIVSLLSFINGSMGTAVQRFYSIEIGKKNEEKLSKIFGTGLYIHIIVALITVVIAEIFAIFFLNKLNIPPTRMATAHLVFQISVVSLALNIINVPYSALLRAREEFSKMAIIDIIQAVLRLLILFPLFYATFDKLIIFSILNLFITIYYVGAITFTARKYNECKVQICRDKQLINEMLKFVSLLLITVLASLFRDKGIVIFINLFFGLAINAAYAIAIQIMHLVSTFVSNFKQSVVPQLMSAYGANDINSVNVLVNLGTKITFVLMLIISLPLMIEINTILDLWLESTPQYTSNLVILALININISSFTYFMYQGVHATGKITYQQTYMSILYILNIITIYIAFKFGYSFYSAFYVTIFYSCIQCIINVYFAHKYFEYKVHKFINIVIRCFTCIVPIVTVLLYIQKNIPESFTRIIISIFVTIICSILLGYKVILNNKEQKLCIDFIAQIKQKKKNKFKTN